MFIKEKSERFNNSFFTQGEDLKQEKQETVK